ncbi:MAG TPA: zinc-binding alcohol dehydrogenase family protein [Stellaceae bacterium]|nr:zinc-binding alcohol dehydrogenase family protein [Stellaceae bacterium]
MRNLVVFGPGADGSVPRISLEGAGVPCALMETAVPDFDPAAPENAAHVLVRKRGFSVNYRDRALILSVVLRAPAGSFYPIGSDFVGEVVAMGPGARGLAPGDRVIGNAAYPDSGVPGVRAGVPVNSASKELQVFHAAKLAKIPAAMTDEVAACFTIGAQTSFSMVRKLELAAGEHVLVTAGGSNTSLFALAALRRLPIKAYVTTTSPSRVEKLRAMGGAEVLLIDRERPDFIAHPAVRRLLEERGGFDAVIDPFFDIHLAPASAVMRQGARYVTCGMYDQHSRLGVGQAARPMQGASQIMTRAMLMNHRIIGNCIGLAGDLDAAVAAHAAGEFPVLIDSVFRGEDAAAFLERSYNDPERFGKVAFLYT